MVYIFYLYAFIYVVLNIYLYFLLQLENCIHGDVTAVGSVELEQLVMQNAKQIL